MYELAQLNILSYIYITDSYKGKVGVKRVKNNSCI
jgi:hypothetical protein